MIRVKAVIPSTSDGKTVIADMRTSICSESEYVVLPAASVLELNAERLNGSAESEGVEIRQKTNDKMMRLRIILAPLTYSKGRVMIHFGKNAEGNLCHQQTPRANALLCPSQASQSASCGPWVPIAPARLTYCGAVYIERLIRHPKTPKRSQSDPSLPMA